MISLTSNIKTSAHSWPVGTKLLALAVLTTILFKIETLGGQVGALIAVFSFYMCFGWAFTREGIQHLRVLWLFWLVVVLWHGIEGSFEAGFIIVLRMTSAFAIANFVTMSTALGDMLSFLQWMLSPLARLGINTRPIELSITLCIRFIPTLRSKGEQLGISWRARSHKRVNWKIVTPFVLLALDDAEQICDSLKARGGALPPRHKRL